MNVDILDHDHFRQLVEDKVLGAVQQHASEYPVQISNNPFKQPKDSKWVSLVIKSGESVTRSLGKKFIERTPGFVQIDIMHPAETGHAAPKKLAHKLAASLYPNKFAYATVTQANFWKKLVDEAPTTGSYFRIMARVFFWYDGFVERQS
ncbi:hypothetical protein KEU06_09625 [Pseudaminobacter sp. 19-2017]|uniref:Uncharacterized protein n=1 Tax=Pseudaminobacter soli (ex Zhang et al. 2022) TaxID=2831468 RepID=A0A942E0Y4_9HYPH|nr:phage tail terminator-like protein [Pseudaminobacter soli]MBS3648865.1 hypothetical protein [Pseudaminobacter soli]